MSSIPEHIIPLILRFLQNTINKEEEKNLNEWLCKSDENKEIFRQYLEIWDNEKLMSHEDLISKWRQLDARLEPVKRTMPGKSHRIRKYNRWITYAAVFIGIIFGTALWYVIDRGNNTEPVPSIVENQGGVMKYVLPDGSIVWLHAFSKLSYSPVFDKEKRVVCLDGNAYFEVEKDESRPFIVHSGNIDVRVTGTEFMVESIPDTHIAVTLVTGGVNVDTRNERGETVQQIRLFPGQQAGINPYTGSVNISAVDAGYYTEWKDGIYRFTDESLGNVIRQLSFRYQLEIHLPAKLENKRITGRVTPQHTLEDILGNISEVYPINFRKENNHLYISEKY
ncbi:MAG: FecR domain-containing protein [Bacteroidales bacterium]|jgi:ferric-dicitrate binding protein FerR (iron transport regulator)|nr:FecR domain-containing protein [Bacteroidales bacterium]